MIRAWQQAGSPEKDEWGTGECWGGGGGGWWLRAGPWCSAIPAACASSKDQGIKEVNPGSIGEKGNQHATAALMRGLTCGHA